MRTKTWQRFLAVASLTLFALPVYAALAPRGNELRVNNKIDYQQRNPAVAFSTTGNAVVVWENDQMGLRARFYGKGGQAAGNEFVLAENTWIPAEERMVSRREPAVVFLSENTFGVAWTEEVAFLRSVPFMEQREVLEQDIYFQRFNGQGVPLGARVRVNSAATGMESHPRVIARGGNILVVWEDAEGGILGRWLNGQEGELRLNTAPGSGVTLAAANNRFIAVWQGEDGSETGVFARLFDFAGKAAGPEFLVNTDTEFRQRRSSVAADAAGNFLVVWQTDFAKTESHLFAQLIGPGGNKVGGQLALDTGVESGKVQMAPAVAFSGGGRFLVTWLAWPFNRAGLKIAGREFNAAGAAQGDVLWLSERQIERNFRRTAVATDGKGGFLVAWETVIGRSRSIGGRQLE